MGDNHRIKKIIFLSTYYVQRGAPLNSMMLAELLATKGHDAQVWYLMKNGDMQATSVPLLILMNKVAKNPWAFAVLLWRFVRKVYQEKPDVITGFHPLANILGAVARLLGLIKRFIATQRNPASSQSRHTALIEKCLGMTPLYHANVCVSKSVAQTYAHYPAAYTRTIKVIYNGVPPLPKTPHDKTTARQHLGMAYEGFLIGSLGRLHPQKNISFLIECLAKAPADMHLVQACKIPLLLFS